MKKLENEKILTTQSSAGALRWDMLLEMQVAAFLPFEIYSFLNSSGWQKSQTVLDIGCGNGSFLAKLIPFFSKKEYMSIDSSIELISAARNNPDLSSVDIRHANFFDFEPDKCFDSITMRLVFQHLSGVEPVLAKLDNLLVSNGRVFIIEPDLQEFRNEPPTKLFFELLDEYSEMTRARGLNRNRIEHLVDDVGLNPKWSVASNKLMISPQVGPFVNKPLMQIFALWLEIFESSGLLKSNFTDVRKELEAWSIREDAFNCIGIRFIELEKVPTRL